MSANVMDFTDLGKGVEFMYKGEKFEIPSYTKSEMSQLMDISEKMVDISKGLSTDEKESMDKGEIKTGELKKLFQVQQEFVIAGVKQCTDDGVRVVLTMEKIEGWPWRLCNKISSLIQEMMLATVIGVICTPLTILPTILGVFEIIYAAKLFSNPPQPVLPSTNIAVFEIACVITGNVFSMAVGILSLVFWTMTLLVTGQYAWLAMNLAKRGQGGEIVLREILIKMLKQGRLLAFAGFLSFLGVSAARRRGHHPGDLDPLSR